MARIIDPVLNIFIGTSPQIVSNAVKRQVDKLDPADRQRVATLIIDTMRIQQSSDGRRNVGSDVLQIATPRFEFSRAWTEDQVRNLLVTGNRGQFVHRPGIGSAGAGGIRNNAHVAMALAAANLRQRINQKLDMIGAPSETRQDQALSDTVRINIITFLGGGTGSGVMPALTLLTRYLTQQHNANRPQTAIYAVLPEQPLGLTEEMIRRQRSNTFATLIELITLLHLTRTATSNDSFIFPFGSLKLNVSQLQVVDVIFLYGQGRLTSHTETYEHIAMDLLLRMQDGHGAGFERKRQLPDLSGLSDTDSKGIPARFATSGVTEIVLPREATIVEFAHKATEEVISDQNTEPDRYEDENNLVKQLVSSIEEMIKNKRDDLSKRVWPDIRINKPISQASVDAEIMRRIARNEELINREESELRETLVKLINDCVAEHVRSKTRSELAIERYIYQRIRRELLELASQPTASAPSSGRSAATSRTSQFLDGFQSLWDKKGVDQRRWSDEQNRNNAQAQARFEARLSEIREKTVKYVMSRVDRQIEDRSKFSEIDSTTSQSFHFDGTKVQYGHRYYTRSLFSEHKYVEQLYNHLFERLKWTEDNNGNTQLNARVIFTEFSADDRSTAGQSRASSSNVKNRLNDFITRKLRGELAPMSALDVLRIAEPNHWEDVLRLHLRWALEHARGHLDYNSFQELGTDTRIARQLDVAMVLRDDDRGKVQQILDQENTRPEIQYGLKLLSSDDPDRISVLYTEYGISLRAVKGFSEPSNSYVSDYILSQQNWRNTGSLPPHASDLLTDLVATTQLHAPRPADAGGVTHHDALPVDAMADEVRYTLLYDQELPADTPPSAPSGAPPAGTPPSAPSGAPPADTPPSAPSGAPPAGTPLSASSGAPPADVAPDPFEGHPPANTI